MKTFTIFLLMSFSIYFSAKAQNTFPATGNVGIGTSSPAYPLTVNGRLAGKVDTTWGTAPGAWQSFNTLQLNGTGSTLSNQFQYSGINSQIVLNVSSNFADNNSSRPSNLAGIFSYGYKQNNVFIPPAAFSSLSSCFT
jgi:hypothetical protein